MSLPSKLESADDWKRLLADSITTAEDLLKRLDKEKEFSDWAIKLIREGRSHETSSRH